jgi:hypothetical protein
MAVDLPADVPEESHNRRLDAVNIILRKAKEDV